MKKSDKGGVCETIPGVNSLFEDSDLPPTSHRSFQFLGARDNPLNALSTLGRAIVPEVIEFFIRGQCLQGRDACSWHESWALQIHGGLHNSG